MPCFPGWAGEGAAGARAEVRRQLLVVADQARFELKDRFALRSIVAKLLGSLDPFVDLFYLRLDQATRDWQPDLPVPGIVHPDNIVSQVGQCLGKHFACIAIESLVVREVKLRLFGFQQTDDFRRFAAPAQLHPLQAALPSLLGRPISPSA